MKIRLLPMLALGGALLAGGALNAQRPRVSIGVRIGSPPPVVYVPPSPGPGYYWDGYAWEPQYWAPPAYSGGIWIDRGFRDHDRHWRHDRWEGHERAEHHRR